MKKKTKLNIQKIDIDLIKPYWRNPRKNENTVIKLETSINDYGYNVPIVIDKKNVIICGHARYKALKQMGYTEIDCVISDMNEKKAKKYRLIDNKLSEEAFWDEEMLSLELRDIPDIEEMQMYFDNIEKWISERSGMNITDIGKEEIEKAKTKMTKIQKEKPLKPVICPHCGEEFYFE